LSTELSRGSAIKERGPTDDDIKDIYLLAMWALAAYGANAVAVMIARALHLARAGQREDGAMWRRVAAAVENVIASSGNN
jgi:hypothetical protein